MPRLRGAVKNQVSVGGKCGEIRQQGYFATGQAVPSGRVVLELMSQ
jgi:hypothetical protein